MEPILCQIFSVTVNRKRRQYSVSLWPRSLELRPTDFTQGRVVELLTSRIVGCSIDAPGASFRVVYCTDVGSTLDVKEYTFESAKAAGAAVEAVRERVAADRWVLEVQKVAGLKGSSGRSVLVVANPASGRGGGELLGRRVKRVLTRAGLKVETVTTEHKGHAREYIRDLDDIDRFDSIVVVSGDGVVHEVVNGLYENKSCDSTQMRTPKLSVVPAGSGNALAKSLSHLKSKTKDSGEEHIWSCVSSVIRGGTHPMDLFKLTLKKETRLGFLSLGWGLISDIDIESERLRYLGNLRFTLWGLHRIAHPKKYRARISYVKAGNDHMRYADDDDDDEEELRGGVDEDPIIQIPETLDEPVSGWTVEEDEFIMIHAVNLPFIDSKSLLAPACGPADGRLHLCLIRKEATKADLLKAFLAIETGDHLKLNHVDLIEVKALRLEPLEEDGVLTVDGEVVEVGPLQAVVLPGATTIITK